MIVSSPPSKIKYIQEYLFQFLNFRFAFLFTIICTNFELSPLSITIISKTILYDGLIIIPEKSRNKKSRNPGHRSSRIRDLDFISLSRISIDFTQQFWLYHPSPLHTWARSDPQGGVGGSPPPPPAGGKNYRPLWKA